MTDSTHRPAERSGAAASLADASPAPLFVIQDHRLRYVNRAFASLAGIDAAELVGRASLDVIHPDDRAHLLERDYEQQGTRAVSRSQFRLRRPDGGELWVYATTAPFVYEGRPAIIGTAIEVNERRHAQDAVARSQRLEAVGRLAGGIAHDFNNLLQVVIGHAERLASGLPAESALQKSALEIRTSASRAAQLTDRLLSLGQRQVLEPRSLDVTRLVADLRNAIQRRVGTSVSLVIRRGRRGAPVRADRMRLIHVLAHLVDNAREAMPKGGQLTISTDLLDVDEPMRVERPWLRAGSYVRLQVEDTGTGMDEATLARIFEPFFTTKEVGKGTGLGLALVYGIVTDSAGAIDVASTPGRGSRFAIYLPRVEEVEMRPAGDDAASPLARGHGERVLVVDDEEALVAVTSEVLKHMGYEPVGCSDGAAALAAFDSGHIDAVIADEVMPGLSGTQLATALRRKRADLPIVLVSGYTGPILTERALGAGVTEILKKPVQSREIARALARVLHSARASTA